MYYFIKSIFAGENQRSLGAAIIVFGLFIGAFLVVWFTVRDHLKERSEYQIPLENIRIESPPDCVPSDFVQTAIDSYPALKGQPLSLLDRTLPSKLAVAFEMHPWVHHVESVRVEFPAQVWAKIVFREPIAIVAVPEELYPSFKGGGFPVDSEGVLLPTDYFQGRTDSMYQYLWIEGIKSAPMGGYGESWNNEYVLEAAVLAEYLQRDKVNMDLRRIVVLPNMEEGGEGRYELATKHGTRIVWGGFPLTGNLPSRMRVGSRARFESAKEKLFQQQTGKLSILRQFLAKYGSLDSVPPDQQPIDVSRIQ